MLALKIAVFLLTLCLGIASSSLRLVKMPEGPDERPSIVTHNTVPRVEPGVPAQCVEAASDRVESDSRPGSGSGSGFGTGGTASTDLRDQDAPGDRVRTQEVQPGNAKPSKDVSRLKVVSKPPPRYTERARVSGIEGTVTLRVTFLASGGIGAITTVRGLPCGLTEQAIMAARKMKFVPKEANGVARTTTRPVSYTFKIY